MSELLAAEYRALAEFRHQLGDSCGVLARLRGKLGLPPMQYQLMLSLKGIPQAPAPLEESVRAFQCTEIPSATQQAS